MKGPGMCASDGVRRSATVMRMNYSLHGNRKFRKAAHLDTENVDFLKLDELVCVKFGSRLCDKAEQLSRPHGCFHGLQEKKSLNAWKFSGNAWFRSRLRTNIQPCGSAIVVYTQAQFG
jgi:hypothetical protein